MNEINAQLEILMEMYGEVFVNDMIEKMNQDGTVHSMNAAKKRRYAASSGDLTIVGPSYIEQISLGRRAGETPPPPPPEPEETTEGEGTEEKPPEEKQAEEPPKQETT